MAFFVDSYNSTCFYIKSFKEIISSHFDEYKLVMMPFEQIDRSAYDRNYYIVFLTVLCTK